MYPENRYSASFKTCFLTPCWALNLPFAGNFEFRISLIKEQSPEKLQVNCLQECLLLLIVSTIYAFSLLTNGTNQFFWTGGIVCVNHRLFTNSARKQMFEFCFLSIDGTFFWSYAFSTNAQYFLFTAKALYFWLKTNLSYYSKPFSL